MWKLEITDYSYNRLTFNFEDFAEVGDFVKRAINASEKQLKIEITLERKEGKENAAAEEAV